MNKPSLVSGTFEFSNSIDEVYSAVIGVMTVLGRGAPKVDRLLGKVSGPLKKKQVPFYRCNADIDLHHKAGITTVTIAVLCERDEESSRIYSLDAYKFLIRWLLGKKYGLKLR